MLVWQTNFFYPFSSSNITTEKNNQLWKDLDSSMGIKEVLAINKNIAALFMVSDIASQPIPYMNFKQPAGSG